MSQYSTNLIDKQWQVTEIILDPQHRKRKYSLGDIMVQYYRYLNMIAAEWMYHPYHFEMYQS